MTCSHEPTHRPERAADCLSLTLAPDVTADPEVADLTAALERSLPADLAELVLKDYACTVRRATVAAMLASDAANAVRLGQEPRRAILRAS